MENINRLHIEIISPAGVIFEGSCHMATIPGVNGELGIMNNHEPTLTRLKEGKINIYGQNSMKLKEDNIDDHKDKVTKEFKISGGFAHNVGNKLLILID